MTLFLIRDLHHHQLISIEQHLGICLVPRLLCNIQNPNSLVHKPTPIPSTSSINDSSFLLTDCIRSPVPPSLTAQILLPASSSSDTLYSANYTSPSLSEHILPVFIPTPIDLTERDETNPITLEQNPSSFPCHFESGRNQKDTRRAKQASKGPKGLLTTTTVRSRRRSRRPPSLS